MFSSNLSYVLELTMKKEKITAKFYQLSVGEFLSLAVTSLRANVTNGQTFGGNRSKINSAHILMLGRP